MTPIKVIGTFILANKLTLKKKQPMGIPAFPIAATVATAVCETVTTSSPGPTSHARSAKDNASVPLPTPMAYAVPT